MSVHRPPIAVVGAGVAGLSSAIRLREAGWPVTIFAARRTPDTTSNRAGAVFTPFRIDGLPQAGAWTRHSYRVFCELARSIGPAAGLSIGPLREYFFAPLVDKPWWAEGVEGWRRLDAVPPCYADGIEAIVPRMDMRRYMPWLEARFEGDLGGDIFPATVNAWPDLFDRGFQAIVNCAGLGAGPLAEDPAVVPMRGQILHVPPLPGLGDCLVEEGQDSATTYVFPFEDYTVLGGTYERGETREATDEAALAGIVRRCRAMLTACGHSEAASAAGAPRLRALAGLRPARVIGGSDTAVRLEPEHISPGRFVFHNYGHGRAGVTLSWGCADAVARLVEQTVGG